MALVALNGYLTYSVVHPKQQKLSFLYLKTSNVVPPGGTWRDSNRKTLLRNRYRKRKRGSPAPVLLIYFRECWESSTGQLGQEAIMLTNDCAILPCFAKHIFTDIA